MNLHGTTIPHEVIGKVAGAKVLLKPASQGTGVIAGGGVRAVMQALGIQDILTKSMGSANVLNVVRATMDALDHLQSFKEQAILRSDLEETASLNNASKAILTSMLDIVNSKEAVDWDSVEERLKVDDENRRGFEDVKLS